jgi:hypothetical protein
MTALHFIQHHLLALSFQVKALMPSTHVVSDGLASFVAVKAAACSHEPIIHNPGTAKANVQDARFKAINTLLGNLTMWMKTPFRGFKTGHCAMRQPSARACMNSSCFCSSGV